MLKLSLFTPCYGIQFMYNVTIHYCSTGSDVPNQQWFATLKPTANNVTPAPVPVTPPDDVQPDQLPPAADLHAVTDSLHEQARVHNLFGKRSSAQEG